MKTAPLVLASLALVACSGETGRSFGSGGGDASADDTGTEQEECRPSITELRATLEEYPPNWAVEVHIDYLDNGCPMDDGLVHAQVDEGGGTIFDQAIPVDGSSALILEYDEESGAGTILLALSPVEESASYSLTVALENTEGVSSAQTTTTVN